MFLGTRKTIIQKNFKLQLSNSNHVQRSRWQWCHFHDFHHTCQTSTWLLRVYLMFKTKPLDAMRWKGMVGFGVYPGRFWWQKQLMRGFEVGCGPHFFQNKCVSFMVTFGRWYYNAKTNSAGNHHKSGEMNGWLYTSCYNSWSETMFHNPSSEIILSVCNRLVKAGQDNQKTTGRRG